MHDTDQAEEHPPNNTGLAPHAYLPPKQKRKLKGLRVTLKTIERIQELAEKTERTQAQVVDAAVAYFYDGFEDLEPADHPPKASEGP